MFFAEIDTWIVFIFICFSRTMLSISANLSGQLSLVTKSDWFGELQSVS